MKRKENFTNFIKKVIDHLVPLWYNARELLKFHIRIQVPAAMYYKLAEPVKREVG